MIKWYKELNVQNEKPVIHIAITEKKRKKYHEISREENIMTWNNDCFRKKQDPVNNLFQISISSMREEITRLQNESDIICFFSFYD